MDLVVIELQLHLLHVKQMSRQPIHLTHELILVIQITRRRVVLTEISQLGFSLATKYDLKQGDFYPSAVSAAILT